MASLLKTPALLGPARCRAAFSAARPTYAPLRPVRAERSALVVAATAEPAKKDVKKKMDSAVKRAQIAEERRMYNKSYKTACATRIKKVLQMAEQLVSNPVKTEEEVKPLEKLISDAYAEIDNAVSKGVLHENTASRKKARCARHKRMVLMAAGLFKPAADHPDFAKYQSLFVKA